MRRESKFRLTLSLPHFSDCGKNESTKSFRWSNDPFLLFFDIRALWRSGLSARQSARMSEINKMVHWTNMALTL